MKIVFFMGAGFSAGVHALPTMNQFLGEVARTDRISDDDKKFIWELVLDARRANSILESSPTNLEDILSFTVMGDRVQLFDETKKPKGPRIKNILHRIYSTTKDDINFWGNLESFKHLIGKDIRTIKEDISFVTTNYDLIIECTLVAFGINSILPLNYNTTYDSHPHLLYNKEGGIPLFKLHGSLNWFDRGEGEIVIDDRILETRSVRNPHQKILLPAQYFPNYDIPGDILIIPPTFLKPDLPNELAKNWIGAAQQIEQAEILIFLGYSFPPSDVEMKYFLAKCLENNAVLRKIIIADLNAEEICSRLKGQGSGFGSHFKEFLEPKQGRLPSMSLSLD